MFIQENSTSMCRRQWTCTGTKILLIYKTLPITVFHYSEKCLNGEFMEFNCILKYLWIEIGESIVCMRLSLGKTIKKENSPP